MRPVFAGRMLFSRSVVRGAETCAPAGFVNPEEKRNPLLVEDRLRSVRLVVTDVDGVLTPGTMVYDGEGRETGSFSVRDHTGMKYLQRMGIPVAFLSGRDSGPVFSFAESCGVKQVITGAKNKLPAFTALISEYGLSAEKVCYVGDDLPDLPVMEAAGVAAAPLDAHELVKQAAHFVSKRTGGTGVFREIAETILKAQNKWNDILGRYRK